MRTKYGNKKITVGGEVFDSRKELRRYNQLMVLQSRGEISDLKRQVEYELIPNQYEIITRYSEKTGKRLKDEKRLVERKVCYVADFVYLKGGETIVEDTKGVKTKDYILKRKMMLFLKGIRIKEI